jgi:hypothetical protein
MLLLKAIVRVQMNAKSLRGYQIIGACARRFHTVVWSLDSVFTFGLNAGQLGVLVNNCCRLGVCYTVLCWVGVEYVLVFDTSCTISVIK